MTLPRIVILVAPGVCETNRPLELPEGVGLCGPNEHGHYVIGEWADMDVGGTLTVEGTHTPLPLAQIVERFAPPNEGSGSAHE